MDSSSSDDVASTSGSPMDVEDSKKLEKQTYDTELEKLRAAIAKISKCQDEIEKAKKAAEKAAEASAIAENACAGTETAATASAAFAAAKRAVVAVREAAACADSEATTTSDLKEEKYGSKDSPNEDKKSINLSHPSGNLETHPTLKKYLLSDKVDVKSSKEARSREERASTSHSSERLGFTRETNLAKGESPKKRKVSSISAAKPSPNVPREQKDDDSDQSEDSENPEAKRKYSQDLN